MRRQQPQDARGMVLIAVLWIVAALAVLVTGASRAVREGHLLSIDPTLLVGGLGPRLPDALRQLSHAFYPQLQAHRAEASQ